MSPVTTAPLQLPPTIVTKVEFQRLVAQMEQLDSQLNEAQIRARATSTQPVMPSASESLLEFIRLNQIQIHEPTWRTHVISSLHTLKQDAPIVHVTFAAEADRESLERISAWLRNAISPYTLMTIGLQPSLIGGVFIRTANRVFDLSLRAQLADHRDVLVRELEAL